MKFEDVNEFDGTQTCYPVCNESVRGWHKALENITVERAAGICSGGEVSFFGFLPRVTKELVLVDHSYGSLWYALGKAYIIEKLGPEEAHKRFATSMYDEWGSPKPPADYAAIAAAQAELRDLLAEANKDLPTAKSRSVISGHGWPPYNLERAWEQISLEDVAAFNENKDKVTILHGDIDDLIERGPFDLLYLSNALDYHGRNRPERPRYYSSYYNSPPPPVPKVAPGDEFHPEKIVKPGGYVAFTFSGPTPKAQVTDYVKEWETVVEVPPHRDYKGIGMRWTLRVSKTPEQKEAAVVA